MADRDQDQDKVVYAEPIRRMVPFKKRVAYYRTIFRYHLNPNTVLPINFSGGDVYVFKSSVEEIDDGCSWKLTQTRKKLDAQGLVGRYYREVGGSRIRKIYAKDDIVVIHYGGSVEVANPDSGVDPHHPVVHGGAEGGEASSVVGGEAKSVHGGVEGGEASGAVGGEAGGTEGGEAKSVHGGPEGGEASGAVGGEAKSVHGGAEGGEAESVHGGAEGGEAESVHGGVVGGEAKSDAVVPDGKNSGEAETPSKASNKKSFP